MNRIWKRLAYTSIVILIMVVGWDILLTSLGLRDEFTQTLPTISSQLIPTSLQEHLK
jgi:hypothetical protein